MSWGQIGELETKRHRVRSPGSGLRAQKDFSKSEVGWAALGPQEALSCTSEVGTQEP